MHLPIIAALLPTLAMAADFQVTSWVCDTGFGGAGGDDVDIPGGDFSLVTVRAAGQTGCSGCTTTKQDDGYWHSGNPGDDCNREFIWGQQGGGYSFSAEYADNLVFGTCVNAAGSPGDACIEPLYSCAVAIVYDCTID